MESKNNYSRAGIRHFVSDNWASMSEPLCSMSSFVCMVNLWYVHITASMASSAGQLHCVFANLCACYPPRFQLLCTSMSNSETTLEQCRQRKQERRGHWDLEQKSLQVHCCNSPPTHCYLTHACSIIFYIYVVVTSLCCQGVWSSQGYCQGVLWRGVVKEWCQVVLSSGIVKGWCQVVSSSIGVLSVGVSSWFYMWQLYTHSCFVLWLKPSSAHSNENEVPCNCSVSVTCLTNTRSVDSTCRYDWAWGLRHLELQICPDHIILDWGKCATFSFI